MMVFILGSSPTKHRGDDLVIEKSIAKAKILTL